MPRELLAVLVRDWGVMGNGGGEMMRTGERDGREGVERGGVYTNFRHDARDDDLAFPCGLDGGAEIGVVPRVDLALAMDKWGCRMHLESSSTINLNIRRGSALR